MQACAGPSQVTATLHLQWPGTMPGWWILPSVATGLMFWATIVAAVLP